ncbi:hypothetical protein [Pseudomonas sp. HS6]|uniref:hypothetical protein n=1 Tax=Pseudomonas sp. HS6 TaxID=2850559 RepID=UPI002018FC73|nr:hypothetical protein [Pseudomonas sp. HS6]UQS13170.1 hypothetical protein JJN09_18280 [Pseudomonas sp. HS6]
MKNFVTTDWRHGADRIFFFFKETNTYARFNFGDNRIEKTHPTSVIGHWDDFEQHVKDLKFGFNTRSPDWHQNGGGNISWFFYYEEQTPMVCKYSQINDKVVFKKKLSDTDWWPLGNYFDKIVGVMLDTTASSAHDYWVLLNDGRYFTYTPRVPRPPKAKPLANSAWSGLEQYKGRMITAASNDHPIISTYFYIFLSNNEYLRFDIKKRTLTAPRPVDDGTWPGLIAE